LETIDFKAVRNLVAPSIGAAWMVAVSVIMESCRRSKACKAKLSHRQKATLAVKENSLSQTYTDHFNILVNKEMPKPDRRFRYCFCGEFYNF